jgi:hypothetical protein
MAKKTVVPPAVDAKEVSAALNKAAVVEGQSISLPKADKAIKGKLTKKALDDKEVVSDMDEVREEVASTEGVAGSDVLIAQADTGAAAAAATSSSSAAPAAAAAASGAGGMAWVGLGVLGAVAVAGGGSDSAPKPQLTLARSVSSLDEGQSVTFTLKAGTAKPGDLFTWKIEGISEEDVVGGLTTGQVTLDTNGVATIQITLKEDRETEGLETLTFSVAGVPQTLNVAVQDTSTDPNTHLLTAQSDNLTGENKGTAVDDLYVGVVSNNFYESGTSSTYNEGDRIDGGEGNNELQLTMMPRAIADGVEVSNIQTLDLRLSAGGGGYTSRLDMTDWDASLQSIEIRSNKSSVEINDQKTLADISITDLSTVTETSSYSFNYAAAVVDGENDKVNLSLNNVNGPAQVNFDAGIEGLAIDVADRSGAQYASNIDLNAAGVNDITVTGGRAGQAFTADVDVAAGAAFDSTKFAGDLTLTSADIKTAVTGAGDDTLYISGSADASDSSYHLGEGDNTFFGAPGLVVGGDITAGAGVDQVTVSQTAGTSSINVGSGNNTVTVNAEHAGVITGGAGDDVVDAGSTALGSSISLGDGSNTVAVGNHAGSILTGDGQDSVGISGSMLAGSSVSVGGGDANTVVVDGDVIDADVTFGDGSANVLAIGGSLIAQEPGTVEFGNGNENILAVAGSIIGDSVEFGTGAENTVAVGFDVSDASITFGGTDSVLTVGGSVTGDSAIALGTGAAMDVAGSVSSGSTISATAGDVTIEIGGSLAGDVTLAGGDDYLSAALVASDSAIVMGSGDNVVEVAGEFAGDLTAGAGVDTISVFSTTSDASIVVGEGNNLVSVSDDHGGSILAGNGDNIIDISDDMDPNSSIELGNGKNTIDVGDDLNEGASIVVGDGQNTITVGDNMDAGSSITLGHGDGNTVSIATNVVDADVTFGNGDGNKLSIGGDFTSGTPGTVTFGNGDNNEMSVGGSILSEQVVFGSGSGNSLDVVFSVSDSTVTFAGDESSLSVGEAVVSSTITFSGDDSNLSVSDDVAGSTIEFNGETSTLNVGGAIASSSISAAAGDNTLSVGGNLSDGTKITLGSGDDTVELGTVSSLQGDVQGAGEGTVLDVGSGDNTVVLNGSNYFFRSDVLVQSGGQVKAGAGDSDVLTVNAVDAVSVVQRTKAQVVEIKLGGSPAAGDTVSVTIENPEGDDFVFEEEVEYTEPQVVSFTVTPGSEGGEVSITFQGATFKANFGIEQGDGAKVDAVAAKLLELIAAAEIDGWTVSRDGAEITLTAESNTASNETDVSAVGADVEDNAEERTVNALADVAASLAQQISAELGAGFQAVISGEPATTLTLTGVQGAADLDVSTDVSSDAATATQTTLQIADASISGFETLNLVAQNVVTADTSIGMYTADITADFDLIEGVKTINLSSEETVRTVVGEDALENGTYDTVSIGDPNSFNLLNLKGGEAITVSGNEVTATGNQQVERITVGNVDGDHQIGDKIVVTIGDVELAAYVVTADDLLALTAQEDANNIASSLAAHIKSAAEAAGFEIAVDAHQLTLVNQTAGETVGVSLSHTREEESKPVDLSDAASWDVRDALSTKLSAGDEISVSVDGFKTPFTYTVTQDDCERLQAETIIEAMVSHFANEAGGSGAAFDWGTVRFLSPADITVTRVEDRAISKTVTGDVQAATSTDDGVTDVTINAKLASGAVDTSMDLTVAGEGNFDLLLSAGGYNNRSFEPVKSGFTDLSLKLGDGFDHTIDLNGRIDVLKGTGISLREVFDSGDLLADANGVFNFDLTFNGPEALVITVRVSIDPEIFDLTGNDYVDRFEELVSVEYLGANQTVLDATSGWSANQWFSDISVYEVTKVVSYDGVPTDPQTESSVVFEKSDTLVRGDINEAVTITDVAGVDATGSMISLDNVAAHTVTSTSNANLTIDQYTLREDAVALLDETITVSTTSGDDHLITLAQSALNDGSSINLGSGTNALSLGWGDNSDGDDAVIHSADVESVGGVDFSGSLTEFNVLNDVQLDQVVTTLTMPGGVVGVETVTFTDVNADDSAPGALTIKGLANDANIVSSGGLYLGEYSVNDFFDNDNDENDGYTDKSFDYVGWEGGDFDQNDSGTYSLNFSIPTGGVLPNPNGIDFSADLVSDISNQKASAAVVGSGVVMVRGELEGQEDLRTGADVYRFTHAGGDLTLYLAAQFDANMIVFDSNGVPIWGDDDGGDGNDSEITLTDLTAGDYYVAVGSNNIGAFNTSDAPAATVGRLTAADANGAEITGELVVSAEDSVLFNLGNRTLSSLAVAAGQDGYGDAEVFIAENSDDSFTIGSVDISSGDVTDFRVFDNIDTSVNLGEVSLSGEYDADLVIERNGSFTAAIGDVTIESLYDADVQMEYNVASSIALGSVSIKTTEGDWNTAELWFENNSDSELDVTSVSVEGATSAQVTSSYNVDSNVTIGDISIAGHRGGAYLAVENNLHTNVSLAEQGSVSLLSCDAEASVSVLRNVNANDPLNDGPDVGSISATDYAVVMGDLTLDAGGDARLTVADNLDDTYFGDLVVETGALSLKSYAAADVSVVSNASSTVTLGDVEMQARNQAGLIVANNDGQFYTTTWNQEVRREMDQADVNVGNVTMDGASSSVTVVDNDLATVAVGNVDLVGRDAVATVLISGNDVLGEDSDGEVDVTFGDISLDALTMASFVADHHEAGALDSSVSITAGDISMDAGSDAVFALGNNDADGSDSSVTISIGDVTMDSEGGAFFGIEGNDASGEGSQVEITVGAEASLLGRIAADAPEYAVEVTASGVGSFAEGSVSDNDDADITVKGISLTSIAGSAGLQVIDNDGSSIDLGDVAVSGAGLAGISVGYAYPGEEQLGGNSDSHIVFDDVSIEATGATADAALTVANNHGSDATVEFGDVTMSSQKSSNLFAYNNQMTGAGAEEADWLVGDVTMTSTQNANIYIGENSGLSSTDRTVFEFGSVTMTAGSDGDTSESWNAQIDFDNNDFVDATFGDVTLTGVNTGLFVDGNSDADVEFGAVSLTLEGSDGLADVTVDSNLDSSITFESVTISSEGVGEFRIADNSDTDVTVTEFVVVDGSDEALFFIGANRAVEEGTDSAVSITIGDVSDEGYEVELTSSQGAAVAAIGLPIRDLFGEWQIDGDPLSYVNLAGSVGQTKGGSASLDISVGDMSLDAASDATFTIVGNYAGVVGEDGSADLDITVGLVDMVAGSDALFAVGENFVDVSDGEGTASLTINIDDVTVDAGDNVFFVVGGNSVNGSDSAPDVTVDVTVGDVTIEAGNDVAFVVYGGEDNDLYMGDVTITSGLDAGQMSDSDIDFTSRISLGMFDVSDTESVTLTANSHNMVGGDGEGYGEVLATFEGMHDLKTVTVSGTDAQLYFMGDMASDSAEDFTLDLSAMTGTFPDDMEQSEYHPLSGINDGLGGGEVDYGTYVVNVDADFGEADVIVKVGSGDLIYNAQHSNFQWDSDDDSSNLYLGEGQYIGEDWNGKEGWYSLGEDLVLGEDGTDGTGNAASEIFKFVGDDIGDIVIGGFSPNGFVENAEYDRLDFSSFLELDQASDLVIYIDRSGTGADDKGYFDDVVIDFVNQDLGSVRLVGVGEYFTDQNVNGIATSIVFSTGVIPV